jgi:hypothetical protein
MTRIGIASLCGGAHVTRADGAKLRAAIEQHWSDPEPVVLDFSGVRIASLSFFDESLGRLATLYPPEELAARVRVEQIDPGDRDLLNQIVLSRANERARALTRSAIVNVLVEAGIPPDVLEQWDGRRLALYQDHSGRGASLEVARRQAREKAARGEWALDLGHYAVALTRARGAALKGKLDELGIPYEKRSLSVDWLRAKDRSGSLPPSK